MLPVPARGVVFNNRTGTKRQTQSITGVQYVMRTIRTKVYKFHELSEHAQNKAICSLAGINVDLYDWWESDYEDAANVGIKITGFDTGRGNDITGEFIEDACYTAHKIMDEHGNTCHTYKCAESFLRERDEIVDTAPRDENGDLEDEYELDFKLDDVEVEFKKAILEEYLCILRKDYEYLTSDEAIKETLEANEYEFTIDGKMI